MIPIFKSIDSKYRNPVGAVEENTKIHLKIILPRTLRCSGSTLIIIDDDLAQTNKFSMFWCGTVENNYECWECDFTPSHDGLFWYKFEIETCDGKKEIVKCSLFNGTYDLKEPSTNHPMFQITSYKKGFRVPNWLEGGIMYQIFPDRFCFSGEKKNNIPKDRFLHDDWFDVPNYKPNEKGIITNSDYFKGDLKGIESKLDYLESLGVTCIYLNPIFEAHTNHRYDTANYEKIDPLLGNENDFKSLCNSAKSRGIRVMIDGVFNHTGDDSIYFNKKNRYDSVGAYNSVESDYFGWYDFSKWPDEYKSWWGFKSLPEVNEYSESYKDYINGDNGIVRKWIRCGASGWRLDVADELPDCFIKDIKTAAKKEDPDAIVLGEVWEDATTKQGFGKRRRYFLGEELDSVMNYPFREAIINFLCGGKSEDVMEQILTIVENYPKPVLKNVMNILGTHDTQRIITRLAGRPIGSNDREWQSQTHLSDTENVRGTTLIKIASAMQYTLPGVPCIYYGDEVGLEGYKDPFCRCCYPWGREKQELLNWYRYLGTLRKKYSCLKDGEFVPLIAKKGILVYLRKTDSDSLLCAFNLSGEDIDINFKGKTIKVCSDTCNIVSL